MKLDQAIDNAADGVATDTEQIKTLLAGYETRLKMIRDGTASSNTGTTADQLSMAAMELSAALQAAEDATTPTDEQIAAIEREYMELQEAIKEVATGVNTETAQMLLDGDGTIKSVTERLKAIKDRQMVATSTSSSTGTTSRPSTSRPSTEGNTNGNTNGDIENEDDNMVDDTGNEDNPITVEIREGENGWEIDIQRMGSSIGSEPLGSDFTNSSWEDGGEWREIVSSSGAGIPFVVQSYVKTTEADDPMPDPDNSLIFGAWVDPNSENGIQTYENVPGLSQEGGMHIVNKFKGTSTATYSGPVAAIREFDSDSVGKYAPLYDPLSGTVNLTATFTTGADTISGTIDLHRGGMRLTLAPGTIAGSGVYDAIASEANNPNTGTWEAEFAQDGTWLVGSFDWEPNGKDGLTQDLMITDGGVSNANNYERYTGAFGACEGCLAQ